ncbi:right-handed parallel beta-helix repeat-containing protein [bacterium]|nr:right-handed parallel beta-helix repeat-containing protein [bacterium]
MKRQPVRYLVVLLLAILALCSCGTGENARENAFYVSPTGNDGWSGKKGKPFATIEKARDAVRALKAKGPLTKPVTVYIGGGVYTLSKPVVFTPEDSGTAEFLVTYAAVPGESPVVSGGKAITGWKKGADSAWTAEIPEVKAGTWYFRQLFVNGKRCQRARTPDNGFFTADGEISMEDQARFTFRNDDIKPGWAESGDIEVIALQAWAEIRMPIRNIDVAKKIVTLSGKCRPSNREKDARYWVENIREGLDQPGEWYLDRTAGVLSYIPRPGEDMTKAEVIAPVAQELVRFEGKPETNSYVTNIAIRGITFCYTDWSLPAEGYSDVQAAYDIPAVITGNGAQSVTIEGCAVRHVGNYAVEFARGCTKITITESELADLGAGGVKIGEPTNRENTAEQTFGNSVTDNHIHDIGEVYPAACGIMIFLSGGNLISHNHIHDTYYTGISNGWSWGYAETNAKENIIEFNHVHDIGRGMLSDMGGNYNLGVQPGSVIRNNLFHDITSYGYGGWGIYTDEGSSYILIENNIVYRTKSGGFHQHYGRENIVRNNIFANAVLGQIIRSRMEEHLSFTFERNIVYWGERPLLGGNWSDNQYKLDYNLYYNTSGEPVMFKDWTFEQWQKRGQDVHSMIADPLFADPENGNFTLSSDSPAFKLGFKAIDMNTVGPRK